jgi:2-dehydro-3-deoxyphosphogluconate aldolase / (4S)-4-hydroxy-2-oxoglutarate aldolase
MTEDSERDFESSVFARFGSARVIAVLRSPTPAKLATDVGRLAESGFGVIEITTSTPGWDTVAAELVGRHSSACLGVGTVTSREEAEAAARCGAAFVVTPFVVPGLRAWADAERMPLLEAGLTPGELRVAGAPMRPAKLFPASLGGPAYLKAILAIMPGARLVPTGGIAPSDARDYLDAGAFAVGIGSALARSEDPARELGLALGGPS